MENQDEYTFDIEANGLLNASTVDYMSSPYMLKPNFKIHCIVLESHSTGEFVCFYDGDTYIFDGREYRETCGKYRYDLIDYMPLEYTHYQMKDFKDFIQGHRVKKVIGHNIINYDLLACKLYFGIDYEIEPNFWGDNEVEIVDTMVLSKTLNPDRFGGHSLDSLSSETGTRKLAFRKHVPINDRFEYFAADMLYYCIIDNKSNTEVYYKLIQEWGEWNWSDAFKLEQQVADIITRQEHRGMYFDKVLAEKNIAELDSYMEERKLKAEPILPKKQATKGYLKDFIPPKNQFLKSGAVSTHMQNFAIKHEGSFEVEGDATYLNALGKRFKLPIVQEPICDTLVPATLNDTTHIKDWLVGLGWVPSEYKDKDLSIKLKGGAKIKRTDAELDKAIATYVEQTLNSNFCDDRCEFLKTTPDKLSAKLHGAKKGRSLKVLTNPSFTKGQEKEICPNLAKLGERFPYATDIVEYLTYRHRRNSILGGGADWDEDEEPEKGYMAAVREDNRIPTPADTCGAATSRMKHRSVANIPRVTSLYGKQMRALFGVDDNYWQIGYDFDSLEAREEAHFCWRYEDNDREYCNSLLLDKPNDVHTKMSQKIAAIIQRDFDRGPAKSVKYGCLPVDNTEVLTPEGWKTRNQLLIGDLVLSYNIEQQVYEYTPITQFWDYTGAEVVTLSNKWFGLEVTEDHEWIVKQRTGRGETRRLELRKIATCNLTSESNIIGAARSNVTSTLTTDEAKFLGWLLSDGYYKWSESERNSVRGITVSIDQDSKKFVGELREVVGGLFEFAEYVQGTMHSFRPNRNQFRAFLAKLGVGVGQNKHDVNWSAIIANQSADILEAFLDAFWLADGHLRKKSKCIRQKKGNIQEAVMLAINMTGHMCYGTEQSDGMFTMSMSNSSTISGQRLKTGFSRSTDVFCISNKNESFVMRQNGIIVLTGNCTYGAQGAKVAKTIGCDLQTGNLIFDAFWTAAAPLKALKDKLNEYWEKTGKKFILGIDGRKVPTRSAHAILNSLFQSAGVICAKRAMVIHDKLLKKDGLSVDFFKDDWRNKPFGQQMIAYHDEAQIEVTKSLVKFKIFNDKALNRKIYDNKEEQKIEDARCIQEIQKWKETEEQASGKIWSDIKPSPKGGWFVAYSRVGELAAIAVREAGEYYKLNVELTAGYMIGRNWSECH